MLNVISFIAGGRRFTVYDTEGRPIEPRPESESKNRGDGVGHASIDIACPKNDSACCKQDCKQLGYYSGYHDKRMCCCLY